MRMGRSNQCAAVRSSGSLAIAVVDVLCYERRRFGGRVRSLFSRTLEHIHTRTHTHTHKSNNWPRDCRGAPARMVFASDDGRSTAL